MPIYDKATQAALDRYNAETGASHDLAAVQDDPRFAAIQEEENGKVMSENAASPFVAAPCPTKAKKANPNCRIEALQVVKGNRKLVVDKASNGGVFEVVSGNIERLGSTFFGRAVNFNPGKIEVIPVGQVVQGPCSTAGTHKGKTFDVPHFPVKERTDSLLKFECFSDWALFLWKAEPRKYQVKYNTCSQTLNAQVHVYPDIEFGMGFEFKYQREKGNVFTEKKLQLTDGDRAAAARYEAAATSVEENLKVFKPKRSGKKYERLRHNADKQIRKSKKEMAELENRPSELGWQETATQKIKLTESISLFGFYKFSGQEIELKHVLKSVTEKAEKISALVNKIESIVTKLQDMEKENEQEAAALSEAKFKQAKSGFSITYPTFGMKMSGLWEELDGRTDCQYGAAIAMFFKPLIGIEFKYDITYAVLKACGPFGKTVAVIKEQMEKKDVSTLAIVLSMSAKANLELRVEMNSVTESNNAGATGQVEITMKVEIKVVQFRKRMWKYDVVVDIGGSGESGIVFTGKINQYKYSIDFEWTGIKATIVSNTTVTKTNETKGTPPKVTPYKGQKNGDVTDSEENEKTFKIKGEKIAEIHTHTF